MIEELVTGKVSVNAIRDVSIEDLLGREPVELKSRGFEVRLKDGRSLSQSWWIDWIRNLSPNHSINPTTLVLLGHGENSIYLIERELRSLQTAINLVPIIAMCKTRCV